MTVAREKKSDDQRLGSLPLFLSLFLLLLAFFIFLNSISSVEAGKSDRVMASIRASFPGFGDGGDGPGLLDDDAVGSVEESVAARLNEAFAFAFPKLNLNILNEADRILVDVPLERLFVPGSSEPRVTLQVLSRRLAKVLADPLSKQGLETQILFGYGGLAGRLAEDRQALERATVVIENMIAVGSPKRTTSVGLEPGHVGYLRYRFKAVRRDAGSGVAEAPG